MGITDIVQVSQTWRGHQFFDRSNGENPSKRKQTHSAASEQNCSLWTGGGYRPLRGQ
jgi:hypothetical protein